MARSRVELFEEIRKAHDREELGIRALANRFGVHRTAVRQALASPIPAPREQTAHASPALDPSKATIDRWLAEDESAPKKQRHTARCTEHHYAHLPATIRAVNASNVTQRHNRVSRAGRAGSPPSCPPWAGARGVGDHRGSIT